MGSKRRLDSGRRPLYNNIGQRWRTCWRSWIVRVREEDILHEILHTAWCTIFGTVASGLVTTDLKWDKINTVPTVKLSTSKTESMSIKRHDQHEREYAYADMR